MGYQLTELTSLPIGTQISRMNTNFPYEHKFPVRTQISRMNTNFSYEHKFLMWTQISHVNTNFSCEHKFLVWTQISHVNTNFSYGHKFLVWNNMDAWISSPIARVISCWRDKVVVIAHLGTTFPSKLVLKQTMTTITKNDESRSRTRSGI